MTPVAVGMSDASVERWTRDGEVQFAKTAPPTWDRGLAAEADRLRWLATTPVADRVARVVAFESEEGVERLVTTGVPGEDLAQRAVRLGVSTWAGTEQPFGEVAASLAFAFGRALRELHEALEPAACPFAGRIDARLDAAARRVEEGNVDPAEFEPEHAERTPAEVLARLRATRPAGEDLVVTHGDWCYPNVLVHDDGWGMVDLAGLGVACRWYDLGIGSRSTRHNLGADAVPAFFEGYGIEPDEERIAYYVLLDELQ